MVEAVLVQRIGFDSMENQIEAAIHVDEEVYFIDEPGKSADTKAQEWVKARAVIPQTKMWDGRVYPQFVIKRITLR